VSYPIIEARHFTRGREGPIDLVVLHTLEGAERGDTAETVARRFAGREAPELSAHYCVDSDSIVQCVRDADVAWHAPGANHDGLGIVLAGGSPETFGDWRDPEATAVLARAAALVALKCVQYRIPPVWLYAADLVADRRGLTSHRNVALAFHRSDHADPEAAFPSEWFVELVRRRLASRVRGTPAAAERWSIPPGGRLKDPPPTLHAGATGWRVRRLQRLLAMRGSPVEVSGELDEETLQAVVELQYAEGLEPDGVVGPATWRALVAGAARLAAAV
jgi:hypothetical protein